MKYFRIPLRQQRNSSVDLRPDNSFFLQLVYPKARDNPLIRKIFELDVLR